MRRGTRLGQGHVSVTADGSGINEEIVDSVEDAGPGVEKAGKKAGKKYGKGLEDALDRFTERMGVELGRRLDQQADQFGDRFEKSMNKAVKRMGRNMSSALGKSLRDTMDDTLAQFGRMIDTMESRLKGVSGNGSGGGGGGSSASGNSANGPQRLYTSYDFYAKFEAARLKMHADANKAIEADDRKLVLDQQKLLDRLTAANARAVQENEKIAAKFAAARVKMHEKSNAAIEADDAKFLQNQQKLFDRLAKDAEKREAARVKALNKASRSDRSLGDMVGGLFGAGSRNNALNLMGRSIGGIVSLTERGAKFAQGFGKGFSEAAESAGLLQRVMSGFKGAGAASGLARAFAGIGAAGPGAVAAIFAVVVAMSAMVSVAGALLGLLTAMTSVIVSGLVGGLLLAGGAMTAFVAAGGLLTAAFMSMTDAQRALLSDAFEPLHQQMVGLGQLMITEMIPYFDTWSSNLQESLLLLLPLATQLGVVFGQAGDIITASLSGPGFQRLSESLGTWLPSIILKMTNALGQFMNGMAGTFAAIMPFVDRFAGYLERVATRWSEFTNSDRGQNAIVSFVGEALDSLQSLWNFVREFSGFIFDVLFDPASQRAGQTIFDGMADAFAGFRESISSGDLERWFNDAIEFGKDLWSVMQALGGVLMSLYNAGVLDAVGEGFAAIALAIEAVDLWLGPFIDGIGYALPAAMKIALGPLNALADAVLEIGNSTQWVLGLLSKVPGAPDLRGAMDGTSGASKWSGSTTNPFSTMFDNLTGNVQNYKPPKPGMSDWLQNLGTDALNQTSEDHGGYKSNEWVNPYVAWAQSLIDNGPSDMAKVKIALRKSNRMFAQAIREVNKEVLETLRSVNQDAAKAIRDAAQADSADSVQSALSSVVESMMSQTASAVSQIMSSARSSAASLRNAADSTVQAAQSSLNSAASALSSATTPEVAAQALADVYRAQAALAEAEKAADKMDAKADRLLARARKRAERMQKRVDRAQRIIDRQQVVSARNVASLVAGLGASNATLADYAEARSQVAEKLAAANQKLSEAIQLRDDFRRQITDSIKSFGALTTAQAKVVDGVEQALTATDITSNLEDRLAKIKRFQENLRVLLAMGLNNSAYKQILEAGVDQGGAFAEALVQGGQGAVGQTNALTNQIDTIANQLGLDASNRLYQAGVDAAQGLVDGLESLSAELDSAATRLGEAIAEAVARALGIHSPSKVLDDMMDPVGDGAVNGLDRQGPKVGAAARRFSDNIAVSPEVAAWATRQGEAATVSGNGDRPTLLWTGDVRTETADPEAVAHEVLNEVIGRLG